MIVGDSRSSGAVSRYRGGAVVTGKDIVSRTSLVSERERMQKEVDEVLSVFSDVYDEYGTIIGDIQLAELTGRATNALAFYDDNDNIAVNTAFFSSGKMDKAMADCVKSGFHPSMGDKTGLQAVIAHELGHKLTAEVGAKMGKHGWANFDSVATDVVKEARKQTGHKGVVQMASKISKYATSSNAEAIAEAFGDVFCNGKKAQKESIAIVNVMNKYLKK